MRSLCGCRKARLDPLRTARSSWSLEYSLQGEPMLDFVFLAVVLAAFTAFAGLTYGCDRL
jgi:hypothetical protein